MTLTRSAHVLTQQSHFLIDSPNARSLLKLSHHFASLSLELESFQLRDILQKLASCVFDTVVSGRGQPSGGEWMDRRSELRKDNFRVLQRSIQASLTQCGNCPGHIALDQVDPREHLVIAEKLRIVQ